MIGALHRAGIALGGFGLCALLAVQPAFGQIKPGVTQSAAHTANVTGMVTQSSGTPVAGADVSLTGSANVLATKSDSHGAFSFTTVPWGTYDIVVTSSFGTASRSITINGDITVAIQYEPSTSLRTIAHVSTSSAGAHINVTSSDIYSVSPSQYAFEGNSTWEHLFSQIPGVTISGGQNAGLGAYSVYADNPNPGSGMELTVNGGLAYETSTTLDGMPISGTGEGAGFDVSTLPMNGFEGADIVGGPGAEAPTIVDSIGGTFVLHAPGQVTTDNWELAASNDPYGGTFWNARASWRFGRLSATFAYGANNSPGPLGSTNSIIYPFTYFGPIAINGIPVQQPVSNYHTAYLGDPECYCSVSTTLLTSLPGSSSWARHDGSGDLTYQFTPTITAEFFYAGSSSSTSAYGSQLPEAYVNFTPQSTSPGYSGNIAPSPAGQFNYDYMVVASNPNDAYSVSNSLWEEKVTAAIGQGVLRVAALQDKNLISEGAQYSEISGLYPIWGTADLGATYPGTPTAFNGAPEQLTFPAYGIQDASWSDNRDYLASYAVQIGSSSSIGASYTTSYYNAPGIENILSGGVPVYLYSTSNAVSESTKEARVHFSTDIGDKLSLGLSWYFAKGTYHFQQPGSPTGINASPIGPWETRTFPYSAPRFGAVWQANTNIAVRAAAGGGYALPPLYDLSSYTFFCSSPYCYLFGSNPLLKPETSFGLDLGTDVRLDRDTVISVDAYRTNLYGAYYSEEAVIPASVCGPMCGGFPLITSDYNNLSESRMEGINFEAHRNVPSGLYWTANMGLTRAYVVSVPAGFYDNPALHCNNCVNQAIIPGLNYNTAAGDLGTIPYSTAYAEVGWRWRPGTFFGLAGTYYGPNNAYYTVRPFVEADARVGYAINPHVSLLVTLVNVTGVYDRSIQLSTPTYLIPVLPNAPPNFREPNVIPYGPRAITVTTILTGGQ